MKWSNKRLLVGWVWRQQMWVLHQTGHGQGHLVPHYKVKKWLKTYFVLIIWFVEKEEVGVKSDET